MLFPGSGQAQGVLQRFTPLFPLLSRLFLPSRQMRLMRPFCLFLVSGVLCLTLLAGCGGNQSLLSPLDRAFDNDTTQMEVEALLANDPKGPLRQPQLPPELAGTGQTASSAATNLPAGGPEGPRVEYEVVCLSPDAPELAEQFLASSTLVRRLDTPLYSTAGLEQRLKVSMGEASEILRSFGFYSGKAYGSLKPGQGEASADTIAMLVTVQFQPGPQYLVGSTSVVVEHGLEAAPVAAPPDGRSDRTGSGKSVSGNPGSGGPQSTLPEELSLPASLEDVGLAPETPARADTVLEAVDRVRNQFRNNGFPLATIALSRFFLNHETHRLDAVIHVSSGPFMRMGPLEVQGDISVTKSFLLAKQTWEEGEPWHQDKVEQFREALRQSGLFSRVDLDPAETGNASAHRPVVLSILAAPERTVSAAVKYDTDFGFGFQGAWEHRNLTGRGDSLRLELPLWEDMQELSARYRLPYFLRNDQDFLLQGAVLKQKTDAYELEAGRVAAGIERRLTPNWNLSALGSVEGGAITDPGEPRTSYHMYGLPVTLTYDNTNSLLDATRGGRASFMLAPYAGAYGEAFTALRSRVDLQRFVLLADDGSLVLALRGSLGALYGADAPEVPPSARFYSGGGGSVRGYEFQSLGPRNKKNDPLGGSALIEWTVEPRWRLSDTWGVVAFVDGGMVYDDFGDMGKEMQYGAGMGLRIFTAIGPMRLDVATPLNPRDDDDFLQFYISIGQSF